MRWETDPELTVKRGSAMIAVVVQYLIPAVSLLLAGWDRQRTALWLGIGGFYGFLGLVLTNVEPGSLPYLALVMLAPLVYSIALIALILACEERWG